MKDLINILTEKLLKDKAVSSLKYVNEIKVFKPTPLPILLSLQSRIKATRDVKEKLSLAIQCAEIVLHIFEERYPDDKRPREAIEAAKACLADPTKENINAAYDASYDANSAARDDDDNDDAAFYAANAAGNIAYGAAYAADTATYGTRYTIDTRTSYTIDTTYDAIEAVKKYYN